MAGVAISQDLHWFNMGSVIGIMGNVKCGCQAVLVRVSGADGVSCAGAGKSLPFSMRIFESENLKNFRKVAGLAARPLLRQPLPILTGSQRPPYMAVGWASRGHGTEGNPRMVGMGPREAFDIATDSHFAFLFIRG